MRPPGSPRRGDLAGFIERPRGSAPRERDHRGGDHPVPSRTRQLSPPSPRVLQREAAGGQGVALAEGAFLCLRGSAREEMCGGAPHAPGEARRGGCPLAGLFASWGTPEGAFPRPGGSTDGGACVTSADRGAGGPPGGASLPGGPSFGRCAPARFCAVCAPCNQSWCFRWLSLRGGLVGGRLSFVMRRFPIRIFVGHRKRLCGL